MSLDVGREPPGENGNDLRALSSCSDYGSLQTPLSQRHIDIKTESSTEDNVEDSSRPVSGCSRTTRDSERIQPRATSSNLRFSREPCTNEPEQTCDKITINVGGHKFTTYRSTLQNIPNTRLSRLSENDISFDRANKEFFFDRNARCFESILDFYRTGKLHFLHCQCGPSVKQELDFWQINEVRS